MPSDQHAPATQQDIHLLMEQMGKYYQQTEQRFVDKEGRETRRHFDVVAENIRHDFQIEEHVGIAA